MTLASIKTSGITLILGLSFFHSIAQSDPASIGEIEAHRKKQQDEMRDPEKSPLPKKERKRFEHLNYYPIDLSYRLKATFVKTENAVLFKMKTTTTRLPEYSKYGEVHFELKGTMYKLEVYHNSEIAARPGLEDYLFIPFTDESNGKETYEVGRYIDFKVPSSNEIVLDFNLCYNPYCSYSSGYSCPIPPEVNFIPLEIKAGELKYKSEH
jgi:uncharacterized protein (DUF1684 family)